MVKKAKIDVFQPVHFHGALPLQSMYSDIEGLEIDRDVTVWYTPDNHLREFRGQIKAGRVDTGYNLDYKGSEDALEEMLKQKRGNVLVLACPNVDKIDVIDKAIEAGYEMIICDKPWVIEKDRMGTLEKVIEKAEQKGTIIHDIMTERYELGTIMQGLIMQNDDLFGGLDDNTPDNPAITKRSVHILDKSHLGVERRPDYFDVAWQGEGNADVTAHLADMANLLVMQDRPVYPDNVRLIEDKCRRWATNVPQSNFEAITKTAEKTPGDVYCNGEFVYQVNGVNVGIKVDWALSGKDDEHYSVIRGKKVIIDVVKGSDDDRQHVYITPRGDAEQTEEALKEHVVKLRKKFDDQSINYEKEDGRFKLVLPKGPNHFEHFEQVSNQAFRYLAGQDPYPRSLEMSRLLTKYYLTTGAVTASRKA